MHADTEEPCRCRSLGALLLACERHSDCVCVCSCVHIYFFLRRDGGGGRAGSVADGVGLAANM